LIRPSDRHAKIRDRQPTLPKGARSNDRSCQRALLAEQRPQHPSIDHKRPDLRNRIPQRRMGHSTFILRENFGLGRLSGVVSFFLWPRRDALYQKFCRMLLAHLPVPARRHSRHLPVSGGHYDFKIIFVHRLNMADSDELFTIITTTTKLTRYRCRYRRPTILPPAV
jgi:hypothetical protein